jgi:hypothetical protein
MLQTLHRMSLIDGPFAAAGGTNFRGVKLGRNSEAAGAVALELSPLEMPSGQILGGMCGLCFAAG